MRVHGLLILAMSAASGACPRDAHLPALEASHTVAVGAGPSDVAAGDLDRDGALDLVSANGDSRTISVRLQRDGTWVPGPGDPLPVAVAPHMVAVGDLDRDGDLDVVATAHDSGAVFAWLGDGTGRFSPARGSPFGVFPTGHPHNHGLAVGDLDGDGDADIVVADQNARAAGVLLADGKGRLAPAPASPVVLGAAPYPPALGDIDRDGRLDLVVPLIGGQAVAVLLGDGAGGFRPAPGSPVRTVWPRPYAVMLGDLDRDGTLDVVAAHDDTDEISVLLGDGHGGLRAAPGSPVALGWRIWRGALVDLDGDGALDLVAPGSGSLVIARGDGHGRLALLRREPVGGWTAIAADLDGDGRPDVVAPEPNAAVLRIWLSHQP
ncbi:MAG TPA: VCBS repeat-containing protein [Thermoanaerobaculia bacterium]|nr:VCBS repeat-containing protein [Thermoanaerobaculia bacterium]